MPQRSLTDELDRSWMSGGSGGMRVVRLTGEDAVDADLVRGADLWVATTEKFESMCRTGSLRAALDKVGCPVVDEVHLLGDPARGALLEALLAHVREDATRGTAPVRIVGLSATVANAEEVATWLGARLVRTPWRPTRLVWQLPVLPMTDADDWAARAAVRAEAAVRIARAVTGHGGSVLVFCGSKRRVRQSALALAADRGTAVDQVDPDDVEAVERVCTKAGVRLHYRDWPYKRQAEAVFRAREADVLVATSTVAAGANLPARADVVSDTTIGLERIEVSMVQQMFGRAGRIGAGEREGWAFLLTDPDERSQWQARLGAGYTVRSRLAEHLPDHLLAEAVQGRHTTREEAEAWWQGTFAARQGHDSTEELADAPDFLLAAGQLTRDAEQRWRPTAAGRLTSRLMVEARLADDIARALREAPVPTEPQTAEHLLAAVLSTRLPALEQAPFSERARHALHDVLRAYRDEGDETLQQELVEPEFAAGDLSRAVLLLAADRVRAENPIHAGHSGRHRAVTARHDDRPCCFD